MEGRNPDQLFSTLSRIPPPTIEGVLLLFISRNKPSRKPKIKHIHKILPNSILVLLTLRKNNDCVVTHRSHQNPLSIESSVTKSYPDHPGGVSRPVALHNLSKGSRNKRVGLIIIAEYSQVVRRIVVEQGDGPGSRRYIPISGQARRSAS